MILFNKQYVSFENLRILDSYQRIIALWSSSSSLMSYLFNNSSTNSKSIIKSAGLFFKTQFVIASSLEEEAISSFLLDILKSVVNFIIYLVRFHNEYLFTTILTPFLAITTTFFTIAVHTKK